MNTIENAVYKEIATVCNNDNTWLIARNTVEKLFTMELERIIEADKFITLDEFVEKYVRKFFRTCHMCLNVEHRSVSISDIKVNIAYVLVFGTFIDENDKEHDFDFDFSAGEKALKLVLPPICKDVHEGVSVDLYDDGEMYEVEIDELED